MHRRTLLIGGLAAVGAAAGAPRALAQSGSAAEAAAVAIFRRPKFDKPLPDGQMARGTRNITAAWLSDPTPRYRHFKLGSEHEAATLTVATGPRRVLRLTLPEDSVFEDRAPRIADVDGDGRDEVIVVRSYQKTGAGLAIVAVGDDGLEIIAETPPIGQPHRWLNPAGVGDLDGDGRPEIALVTTPHLGGELQIWRLQERRLRLLWTVDDVSNHVAGSPQLGLSAIADFDDDGIADLAVPSFDRRALRFLGFKGGRPRDLGRVMLPGRAGEDFKVARRADGSSAVAVGLTGGRVVTVGL